MGLGDSFPTGNQLDVRAIGELWGSLDRTWQVAAQVEQEGQGGDALTARRFDESQTAGHRVYIAAWRLLGVAFDNHRALQHLLTDRGALPWAIWSLLRPSLEAAFWATWVLDPDDGPERRRRGLRLEIVDHKQRKLYLEEYKAVPNLSRQIAESIAEHEARVIPIYRQEAKELGLTWDQAGALPGVVSEIGKLECARSFTPAIGLPGMLSASWRCLSGFQHGYGYAMVHNSEISGQVPIPGGQLVTTVVDDDAFAGHASLTAWLMNEAASLYIRRSRRVG